MWRRAGEGSKLGTVDSFPGELRLCSGRHRFDLMQDMLKSERTFCEEELQRISTETLGSQSLPRVRGSGGSGQERERDSLVRGSWETLGWKKRPEGLYVDFTFFMTLP